MALSIAHITVNGLAPVPKATIISADHDVVRKLIDTVVEGSYE